MRVTTSIAYKTKKIVWSNCESILARRQEFALDCNLVKYFQRSVGRYFTSQMLATYWLLLKENLTLLRRKVRTSEPLENE
jgi:hypothetical protein